MIQAPYTLVELDYFAKEHFVTVEQYFNLRAKLHALALTHFDPNIRQIAGYLHTNIVEIIAGRPAVLQRHLGQLEPHITAYRDSLDVADPPLTDRALTKQLEKDLGDIFLPIFNYDFDSSGYTKKSIDGISGGLAYEHAKKLSLNTCLYCNAQFTFTVYRKKSVKKGSEQSAFKTRPNFDHFISKARFPFFALSFYNLIPACKVCNSDLKGSTEFLPDTHLHPFIEGLQDTFEFKTSITAVDYLGGKKDFDITVAECPDCDPDKAKRIKESLDVFAIVERYNEHKDYAGEIIMKAHIYNNEPALKSLFEGFTIPGTKQSIFRDENEIIELALGNYLRKSQLHKRILSKLTKDIAKEVGLKVTD